MKYKIIQLQNKNQLNIVSNQYFSIYSLIKIIQPKLILNR